MVQFGRSLVTKQIQMIHDLDLFHGQCLKLCGAQLSTDTGEEETFTRGRMSMHRFCVYHVGQNHFSRSAALCVEIIATMCSECIYYQVDVMAGDGNKAAYLSTLKNPGCPTYEVSLLQFWTDRMINTATQPRIKNYGPSPPVRAKHFITCPYNDLVRLSHHLRGIKTETYTTELANKADGCGDCCMLTLLEWGHARNDFTEDVNDFDDEEHMNHVGEFVFQVNETCLSGDHRTFLVSPNDNVTPADLTHNERRTYVPAEPKQARKERRKEKQKANKRKSHEPFDYGRDEGYYGQSSASSSSWRPTHR